ncbi:MAG TPA: hypothetical protein VK432_01535 [Stellaceae bacterium]|nr:hypothetical protein [Stellaceae bacterium]
MRLMSKIMFGVTALAAATATTYPQGFSNMYFGGPHDLRKQEALKLCQQQSLSFVTFLASDREQCYREMRNIGTNATFSGVWSKPDREHMQSAEN